MNFAELVRMISEGKDPEVEAKKKFPAKKVPEKGTDAPVKDDGKADGAEEVPAKGDPKAKEAFSKDDKGKPPFGKKDDPEGDVDPEGQVPMGDEDPNAPKDDKEQGEMEGDGEEGEEKELDPEAVTGTNKTKVDLKPKIQVSETSVLERATALLDRLKALRAPAQAEVRDELSEGSTDFVSVPHHAQQYHYHDRQIRLKQSQLKNVKAPAKQELMAQIAHHDRRCEHHASMLEKPVKS
jgi:hypothetical protein